MQMKELLSISLIVLATMLLCAGAGVLHFLNDEKIWNDGYCTECNEGNWEYEEAVGHRSGTTYIYVCDECGTRHEFSQIME